ncbi:MAG: hypothetical protein WAN43_04810 [Rhodomicrobium sp.]
MLLYLAALRGFHLIKDRAYDGATFSEIEESTCIPRRGLRDALNELGRNRMVAKRWGRYAIREPALPIVKAEFDAIRDAKKKEKEKDKKEEKKEEEKEEKKEEEKEKKTEKSKPEGCLGEKTNIFFAFSSGKD